MFSEVEDALHSSVTRNFLSTLWGVKPGFHKTESVPLTRVNYCQKFDLVKLVVTSTVYEATL